MAGRLWVITLVLLAMCRGPAAVTQSDELTTLKRRAQQLVLIKPHEALAAGEGALEIAESTLGPDHVEVADILAHPDLWLR
jgi:hypothetical protein